MVEVSRAEMSRVDLVWGRPCLGAEVVVGPKCLEINIFT